MKSRYSRRGGVTAVTIGAVLLASAVAVAAVTPFEDVGDDNVHAEAIAALAESGIVEGVSATMFAPAVTVTRGQLASLVARAADLEPSTVQPFSDVTDGVHADNIAAAAAAGLVRGYDDGTYRPAQPVTRAQMASILDRWLQPSAGPTGVFADVDGDVHAIAIEALAAADIALGSDGSFMPAAPLRRDQAASFLYRGLNWYEAQPPTVPVTVMGTSDLHDNALDWDYYNNQVYPDENIGLARIATLVEQVRQERGEESTILLDNGDTYQGNPLATYYATDARITEPDAAPHPMALAMNALGYDAMVSGNHEYNYGLDFLQTVRDTLDFPVLGANVREAGSEDEYLPPYEVVTVQPDGADSPIEVGVLGLTTPGSAVWDRSIVEGKLVFWDGVATAQQYVPILRDEVGVDAVVVIAHSGIDGGSSYGDAIDEPENFVRQLAQQVPGIDAIIAGHTHREVPQEAIVNDDTGEVVVVTQPSNWGRFLSVIDLQMEDTGDGWDVARVRSSTRSTARVPQSTTITDIVTGAHDTVVEYVNSPIGTSTEELSMAMADLEDVPALDLINEAQEQATRDHLPGTAWEGLPVLSLAAPFNLGAHLPAGEVSIADVAGLYIYDNTLVAVEMTGAELEDYLEWSAEYFAGVDDAGPFDPDAIETTKPSYNYDVLSGVTYDLDIAQPVGERVENLQYDGAPIDPDQRFVVATNNYRANGGGGAPHIADAPIVWDSLVSNRQLIIEWVMDQGTVDPADFASVDWQLLANGEPITFTG